MKVLLLANNLKWKSLQQKVDSLKQYFAPALDIQIEIQNISVKKFDWFEVVNRDGVTVNEINRDYMERLHTTFSGYDVIVLAMDKKAWKGGLHQGYFVTINGKHCIALGSNENEEYRYNFKAFDGGKFFNLLRHELYHAIYTIQGKLDRTHYHFERGKLDDALIEITSNKKTLILTRNQDDGVQCLGTLTVDNKKWNTLERPDKNNAPNISCIPKGTYDVKWTFSPKFLKYTYEILNVPSRSGIRIHSANFFSDLFGCVALGNGYKDINGDGRLDIINSKLAINEFESYLNKQDFRLIIK